MSRKIKVAVFAVLLVVGVVSSASASYDEAFEKHWYSDATYTTEVGWRMQLCDFARWWGDETPYEVTWWWYSCIE